MKIKPNELIKNDLSIGISNENMLENKALNQTIRGMKFKVNEDKSITLNGTCECGKNLFNVLDYTNLDLKNNDNATHTITTNEIKIVTSTGNYSGIYINKNTLKNYIDKFDENTTYKFSFDIYATEPVTLRVGITNENIFTTAIDTEKTRISFNAKAINSFVIYSVSKIENVEMYVSSMMVSLNEDITYEPYQEYLEYDMLENAIDNSVKTILPNEYQQVEYIESTGTQYIDTEYKPNQDTKIETKLEVVSKPTVYGDLFGAREANTNQFHIIIRENGFDGRYGTKSYVFNQSELGLHEIIFDKKLLSDLSKYSNLDELKKRAIELKTGTGLKRVLFDKINDKNILLSILSNLSLNILKSF